MSQKKSFVIGSIGILALFMILFMNAVSRIYKYHFSVPENHPLFIADLSDIRDETLSHYYVHTKGQKVQAVQSGLYADPPFDASGIPLVDYGNETGLQYNPVTIAQYGLDNYELFLQTQDTYYLDGFLKQADWLLMNQEEGKWYYRFDHPVLSLKKPWISAMSQGQGISVLMRAYQYSGERIYLESAKHAFEVFRISVKEGGISVFYEYGTWYEEYPDAESPSHVMNGHIWALFGLWDLYRVTRDPEVLYYFTRGVSALRADLDRFDTGYWVLYDLKSHCFLVDQLYIDFKIDQLRALHAITDDSLFYQYASNWEKYQHQKVNIVRMMGPSLWRKVKLKLNGLF